MRQDPMRIIPSFLNSYLHGHLVGEHISTIYISMRNFSSSHFNTADLNSYNAKTISLRAFHVYEAAKYLKRKVKS